MESLLEVGNRRALHHERTLIYRMRRIEELTGRKLNDTSGVAELWIALRAEQLNG